MKISQDEDKILIYSMPKVQPHIIYILEDTIPPSQGSTLFQNSSLNKTPGEILGYIGPNEILEDVPEMERIVIFVV